VPAILGASGITLDYPVMRHASNLEEVVPVFVELEVAVPRLTPASR
jgi:hypothetical protein